MTNLFFSRKNRYYQPTAQRRFYPFFFATRRRNPPVRTLRKYCKGLDRYEAPTVVDPSPSKRLRGSPTRDGSTDRQLTADYDDDVIHTDARFANDDPVIESTVTSLTSFREEFLFSTAIFFVRLPSPYNSAGDSCPFLYI